MRFSTKIIIIALIIMIPVTVRDILNKDLFNLSLDLIVIIINSLSVMLDIKSIKQDIRNSKNERAGTVEVLIRYGGI